MATFIAATGTDFDSLSFSDIVGNFLVTQSPNTWQTQFGFIGNDYVVYHGVGLTYTGGSPTGGTLTELLRYESGALTYSITDFAMPAATFQAFRAADDIDGFFSAVFAGSDNLTGSNQNDNLRGYAGNDNMDGADGSDLLWGGAGNDVINGGNGFDLVVGEDGNDTLDGGAGNDWMDGGAGNDTYYIDGDEELITESLAGAAGGTDRVYSSTESFTLFNNLEQLYLTGNGDSEGVGNSANNTLVGSNGDNTLDGGAGIDSLAGGKGDDLYYVDTTKDVVTEGAGAGSDFVISSADYAIGNNIEQLILTGSNDIDGTGNAVNNYIQGNSGDNFLNGGGGTDTILAQDGNDTINGGLLNDTVAGNGGDDLITTFDGNDTVLYMSILDGHDVINNFDGNAAGGQDVLNLDAFLDQLGVATADRADFFTINDKGASVDIEYQFFGTNVVATINTTDALTIGTDIVVGTL